MSMRPGVVGSAPNAEPDFPPRGGLFGSRSTAAPPAPSPHHPTASAAVPPPSTVPKGHTVYQQNPAVMREMVADRQQAIRRQFRDAHDAKVARRARRKAR